MVVVVVVSKGGVDTTYCAEEKVHGIARKNVLWQGIRAAFA
jgi:hypothetical protein